MNAAHEIPRDEQMLGELAEMELALARTVFIAARAAEDPSDMAMLVRAYQRLARSCRQSIALRARLVRERLAGERPQISAKLRTAVRKQAMRRAVRHILFTEVETERAEELYQLFDESLDVYDQAADWADKPLVDQIVETLETLGLPPDAVARWRANLAARRAFLGSG